MQKRMNLCHRPVKCPPVKDKVLLGGSKVHDSVLSVISVVTEITDSTEWA
jgi:hypothetical protein